MDNLDIQMEVKENRVKVEILNNKLNALLAILKKEGVTSKEEVESMMQEIMQKGNDDE